MWWRMRLRLSSEWTRGSDQDQSVENQGKSEAREAGVEKLGTRSISQCRRMIRGASGKLGRSVRSKKSSLGCWNQDLKGG